MTNDSLVTFIWQIPAGGFQWVDVCPPAKATPVRWLTVAASKGRRRPGRQYQPLQQYPALFRTFADTPPTEAGIVDFANQYGALGTGPRIPVPIEGPVRARPTVDDSFGQWCDHIRHMHLVLQLWDAIVAGDMETLEARIEVDWQEDEAFIRYHHEGEPHDVWYSPRQGNTTRMAVHPSLVSYLQGEDSSRGALIVVQAIVNYAIKAYVNPLVRYRPEDNRLVPEIVPNHLLGVLWLQFAQSLTSHTAYRQCQACGTWFELSPDKNRIDRLFCKNACRSKAYRGRQGKARQLAAEGVSLDAIAQQLGTDAETAQKWVAQREAGKG